MHLQASIVVGQTNEQVWSFFNELSNLARWDRSVAQVFWTSPEPHGVGSTFETIAPVRKSRSPKEGLRMSYRITAYAPNRMHSCRLTNSSLFTSAEWTMSTEDLAEGVRITGQFDGTPRFRYSFLLPILLLTSKGAFHRDLTALKQAIERDALAHQRSIVITDSTTFSKVDVPPHSKSSQPASFSDLAVSETIEADGTVKSDGSLTAANVVIVPPSDGPSDGGTQ